MSDGKSFWETVVVTLKLGKPDQAEPISSVVTRGDIVRRSKVFGPLLDDTDPSQEVYLGGLPFSRDDLQLIIDFLTICHDHGKTVDPSLPLTMWSTSGPNAEKFAIPEDAMNLFRAIKKEGTEDIPDDKRLYQICSLAHFLKIDVIFEAVSEIIVSFIKNNTPQEIQQKIYNNSNEFTEKDEEEVMKKFPWLQ